MSAVVSFDDHISNGYALSESVYSYGYDLRLKHSSFREVSLAWIAKHYAELIPKDAPNVLSLGCGAGLFDTQLIQLIESNSKNWQFTGLDFSTTDLEQFRKSVVGLSPAMQQSINLQYGKFEASSELGDRFDFITMVHFLHSFDEFIGIISNAKRHLRPGGKLLIVQQNKQGVAELKEQFRSLLPNQKFNCAESIKQQLIKEGIRFQSDELKSIFDISVLRSSTLESLLLMSFCLVNDLSLVDYQLQQSIRQDFLNFATTAGDGRAVIHESMEVIVCHA
jgi:ubiquinone/menaquinone biosynthesis C-methylase UbiE